MTCLAIYGTQPTAMSQCLRLYVQHAKKAVFFRKIFIVTFFRKGAGGSYGLGTEALVVEGCSDVDRCESKPTV
jgi:GTP-dependent phosphoenolpyruvate carboxykinase